MQLATSNLFAFIMFGAFLDRLSMSSIFMDLAFILTRGSQGGPAKVAIFASALFGSISGFSAGNVYTTGVFTIPLMKRCGYSPAFAGAVEAVASTGGQIMPPVMGAAAFMMAELAGVSYLSVAKAALLPAVLYYMALYVMIHFEARRLGLGIISDDMIPAAAQVMRKLYYLIPLVVLVYMMVSGRSISSRLHCGGHAWRSCAHQDGRDAGGGSHVRVLLRHPVVHQGPLCGACGHQLRRYARCAGRH